MVLARKKDSGERYAIKIINKDFVIHEDKVSQILNEKNILVRVSCLFIVNFHWVVQTQKYLHIVLDFCAGGELFFHLQNIGQLKENQPRFYFCEILLGIPALFQSNLPRPKAREHPARHGWTCDDHRCRTFQRTQVAAPAMQ